MRRGQGLAGRVFETGEPCKVDEYLTSEAISHDFFPLARLEHARSALGVPLRARNEVIGVLEVWRRRKQRAASQARAEAREEILWDLLEGSPKVRRAAISRARELHIDLTGPHRVIHCAMHGLDEIGRAEGWDTNLIERNRRAVHEFCERALGAAHALKFLGSRGSLLVAIVTTANAAKVRDVLRPLSDEIKREIPGLHTVWGVSAAIASPMDYRAAHREATVAALAASKLGTSNIAIHEELGVVGLLLTLREDADLAKFVRGIIGPVIDHDLSHHGVLGKTLRTYFEANCSQQTTGRKLHVHEKTVRYRLDQFEELTGLDLNRHDDRLLADLALRMHDIGSGVTESDS
jgi:sugar diacid utilization regulator